MDDETTTAAEPVTESVQEPVAEEQPAAEGEPASEPATQEGNDAAA